MFPTCKTVHYFYDISGNVYYWLWYFFMCLVRFVLMVKRWLHLAHWNDFTELCVALCLSKACFVPKHLLQLWHLCSSLWMFSCCFNLSFVLNTAPHDTHFDSPQFLWWYLLSASRLKTFWHLSHFGVLAVKPQSASSRWLCANSIQSFEFKQKEN